MTLTSVVTHSWTLFSLNFLAFLFSFRLLKSHLKLRMCLAINNHIKFALVIHPSGFSDMLNMVFFYLLHPMQFWFIFIPLQCLLPNLNCISLRNNFLFLLRVNDFLHDVIFTIRYKLCSLVDQLFILNLYLASLLFKVLTFKFQLWNLTRKII